MRRTFVVNPVGFSGTALTRMLHQHATYAGYVATSSLGLMHAERIFRSALRAQSGAEIDGMLDWASGRPWAREEGVGDLRRVWEEAKRDPDSELALGAFRLWLEDAVREIRAREARRAEASR